MSIDDRDPLQNDEHLLKRSLTPTDAVAAGACLDAEILAAWADGSVPDVDVDHVERHLATCARCQAMLAAFANAEVAESAYAATAAAATTAATRSSNVVSFKPAFRRWVPIAVGAIAASLVVYAAWPKHAAPDSPRSEEAIASAAPTPQAPPAPTNNALLGQQATIAKATPADTPAVRDAKVTRSTKLASPAPPTPLPAPVLAPDTLRPSATYTPPRPAAGMGNVVLAAPPPPAVIPSPSAKPAEVNLLRAVEETTLKTADAAASRIVAEFGAPTTPTAAPSQSLLGRAGGAVAGGGGGGRGAAGGAGGLRATATPRPIAPVSWRVFASGQVERSTNGGQTWAPVTLTPPVTVVNGTAPSASVCWLIGKSGIVLLSTDGTTFRRVTSPDVADLRSITAISEMEATVTTIDGRIFKTEDGGSHWKE